MENVGRVLLPVFDRDGQECPSYGKGCISRHFAPLQGWVRETHHLTVGTSNPRGAFHAPYLACLERPSSFQRLYGFVKQSIRNNRHLA